MGTGTLRKRFWLQVEKNVEVLKELRRKVKTLHTSAEVAPLYGRIKTNLERAGRVLDDADLLIAAIVVVSKGILITNNTSHFQRIPDVELENWK